MPERTPTRRRLLLAAAGVTTVALAGCVGDDDDTGDVNGDDTDEVNGGEEVTGDGFDVFQDDDYELPTDPQPDDFADMTGRDEVEVVTVWRRDQSPEFVFDPPFVQVDEGTTVRWINEDGVFHTVTSTAELDTRSQSGEFDAQISAEGDTFEWVADEVGRQNYYCTPHAGFMYGAVDVV